MFREDQITFPIKLIWTKRPTSPTSPDSETVNDTQRNGKPKSGETKKKRSRFSEDEKKDLFIRKRG